MSSVIGAVTAQQIISKVAQFSAAKNPRQVRHIIIAELQKAPLHGLISPEFNPIYINLIGLYRADNYIENQLTAGRSAPEEIRAFGVTVSRFLEISEEVKSGKIKLMPVVAKQVAENTPFAKFFAGLFALAQGDADGAALYLLEAEERMSVKPAELADLVVQDPGRAKQKLGPNFEKIAAAFAKPVAPVLPPEQARLPVEEVDLPPPMEPTAAEPIEEPPLSEEEISSLARSARDKFSKKRFWEALCDATTVLHFRPDDKINTLQVQALEKVYAELFSSTDKNIIVKRLRLLLDMLPDETKARRMLINALISARREEEAITQVENARELGPTREWLIELDYLEANAWLRIDRPAKAWELLKEHSSRENLPLFRRHIKLRLEVLVGIQEKEIGLAALKEAESYKELQPHEADFYKAVFLSINGTARDLGNAYNAAIRASRGAGKARQFDLMTQAERMMSDLANRSMAARRAEAEKERESKTTPPPAPVVQPLAPEKSTAAVVIPAEIAAKKKQLAEWEERLKQKDEELFRALGELEQGRKLLQTEKDSIAQAEARLAQLRADLKEERTRLGEWQRALAEQGADLDRRSKKRIMIEVEKIQVKSRTVTQAEHLKLANMIINGNLAEAAGYIDHLRSTGQINAVVLAFEKLISALDVLSKNGLPEIEKHNNQVAEQQALLATIRENGRKRAEELKKTKKDLEAMTDERNRLREQVGQIREELAELKNKFPRPDRQTAFAHLWQKFVGMKDFELSRIDRSLEPLFDVALSEKGRLTRDEVLDRRKKLILWMIERREEKQGFNSSDILRDHKDVFSQGTNKKVCPGGFGQLFGWARLFERLIEELDPLEL